MSKLDGIKAGDRVRVTFEADVIAGPDGCGDLKIVYEGNEAPYDFDWILARNTNGGSFKIARIAQPFKVGDQVFYMSSSDKAVVVAFLKDGRAVIEFEAGDTTNVRAFDVSCLARA